MFTGLLAILSLTGCDPVAADVAVTPESSDETAPVPADAPQGEACESLALSEGEFIDQGVTLLADRDACVAARHAFAGAAGSTLQITLTAWGDSAPASLAVRDLLEAPLASASAATSGDSLTVTLDRSGEFFVDLTPTDPDAAAHSYAVSVACVAGCDLRYTRHPIVLMHGMGGTDAYFELVTYFYGVADALESEGYAVLTPTVDPFAVTSVRAEDWRAHLDGLVAEGAGRRFNLIGHSQGGLDARYLASLSDPGLTVASITTVGTPHRGTPVADVFSGLLDITVLTAYTLDALADGLSALIGSGAEQDVLDQIAFLSTEEMADFNDAVPDRADVAYASWAGLTCSALDFDCIDETGGEVVDPLLGVSFAILAAMSEDSDGMVPVSSAQWGTFLGTIPADHADEIGHILGTTAESFDHIAFYTDEAARLAAEGL